MESYLLGFCSKDYIYQERENVLSDRGLSPVKRETQAYLASRARAMMPAAMGAEADVPV